MAGKGLNKRARILSAKGADKCRKKSRDGTLMGLKGFKNPAVVMVDNSFSNMGYSGMIIRKLEASNA